MMIRNMPWQNLIIEPSNSGNSNIYKISFSSAIADKIHEIEDVFENFVHLKGIGQEILFGDDLTDMNCSVRVSTTLANRIDINRGIPRSIRNLGLGCKIYRAVLSYESYISSEARNLSSHGRILWNSLRKNEMFYTFYYNTRAFCFAADKNPQEIIEILEEKINPNIITTILWDNDFVLEFRPLIEESNLRGLLPELNA